MTIRVDSYHTTMGSAHSNKSLIDALQETIILDGTGERNLGVREQEGITSVFITGFFDSETKVPLFAHPISIFNFRGKRYLCTDLRLLVKKGTAPAEVMTGVRNHSEYNFAKSRAVLNLAWWAEGPSRLKNDLKFAGRVYAAWISQSVSRAFGLDFKDQSVLQILAHLFYLGQFDNKDEWTDEDKDALQLQVSETTGLPASLVKEVFQRARPMPDLTSFCQTAAELFENVRMSKFNAVQLLTTLSGSWYGVHARELVSVALEHVPTWASMVYTALNERSYTNSTIGKVADAQGRRGLGQDYLKDYGSLVRQHLSLESTDYLVPAIRDLDL